MKRSLLLYFALTFALAWALWVAAAALLARSSVTVGRPLFFLPGTFAPAIVALWMAHRSDSSGPAATRLFAQIFHWQVNARWYLFAVSYMIIAKLAAAVLFRLGHSSWPAFGTTPLYLMLLATLFSTPVQAGEEIGWRGFALPRLASVVGWPVASLLLGIIWALWHLPLFLIGGTDSTAQPFIVFLVGVTAISVAITWLYVRTRGSLLLVMLMHAAINNTTGIVPAAERVPAGAFSPGASPMAWLTNIVLWLAATYLLIRMSSARIPTNLCP